jgi:hypothetical protein
MYGTGPTVMCQGRSRVSYGNYGRLLVLEAASCQVSDGIGPELTYGTISGERGRMRRKIRLLDDQTAARNAHICHLYEQGQTLAEVAQEVGVHETTAWRVLSRAGVVRRRGWKQRLEQLAASK